MKVIKAILITISLAVVLWFFASWGNVVMVNDSPDTTVAAWNIFQVLI